MRSSRSNCSSRPPLRKKVTWAYFSVSAMRSCERPCRATYCRWVGHVLLVEKDVQARTSRRRGHEQCREAACASPRSMSSCVSAIVKLLRPVVAVVEEDHPSSGRMVPRDCVGSTRTTGRRTRRHARVVRPLHRIRHVVAGVPMPRPCVVGSFHAVSVVAVNA